MIGKQKVLVVVFYSFLLINLEFQQIETIQNIKHMDLFESLIKLNYHFILRDKFYIINFKKYV